MVVEQRAKFRDAKLKALQSYLPRLLTCLANPLALSDTARRQLLYGWAGAESLLGGEAKRIRPFLLWEPQLMGTGEITDPAIAQKLATGAGFHDFFWSVN